MSDSTYPVIRLPSAVEKAITALPCLPPKPSLSELPELQLPPRPQEPIVPAKPQKPAPFARKQPQRFPFFTLFLSGIWSSAVGGLVAVLNDNNKLGLAITVLLVTFSVLRSHLTYGRRQEKYKNERQKWLEEVELYNQYYALWENRSQQLIAYKQDDVDWQEAFIRAERERHEQKDLKDRQLEAQYQQLIAELHSPEAIATYRHSLVSDAASQMLPHEGLGEASVGSFDGYLVSRLEEYFGEDRIFTGIKVYGNKQGNYLVPDAVYIDMDIGLHIAIESDEPYSLKQTNYGEPIHYIGYLDDERREEVYVNKYKWILVRFAEEQVIRYADSCCKKIAQLLAEILSDPSYLTPFAEVSDLPLIQRWTQAKAQEMVTIKHRDTYFNYFEKMPKPSPKKKSSS
jgi:hypothetical protein